MTTKQYLNQILKLETLIQNKLDEIYRLRQLIDNISIINDKDKVQTSGRKDKLGDSVSEIIDLENDVSKRISEYTVLRQKIICMIDSMPDINHYEILYEKYVNNDGFEIISEKIGYSQRQVIRIHREALAEFEKMYGSEYLSQNVIECHR